MSFGRGFCYGHNWTSVTAPLSATAETRKNWLRSVLDRARREGTGGKEGRKIGNKGERRGE